MFLLWTVTHNSGWRPKGGYATDDGVALHYRGRKLHKVIADTPNKYAYHVMKTDGGVQETRLEAELLSY